MGLAGHFFRTFYISETVPTIIDGYHPNAQSLFYVASKEQAADYVMYFSVVLAGEMGNKQFVLTEDQYDKWAGQCDSNDTSVAKTVDSDCLWRESRSCPEFCRQNKRLI